MTATHSVASVRSFVRRFIPTAPAQASELSEPAAIVEEQARILARRDQLGIPIDGPRIGLALSGGGIRSATVCLGVLRAMAKHGALPKVDYLSTVSGGGYAGSFLCSLYARDAGNEGISPASRNNPAGDDERWRKALDYLRQGGRYLVPSGAQDAIHGVAIAVRNWIAVHAVIATSIVAIVLALDALRIYISSRPVTAWLEAQFAAHDVPTLLWPTTWIDASGARDFAFSWLWPLALIPLAFVIGSGWAFWLGSRAVVWRWRPLRLLTSQTAGAFAVILLALTLYRAGDCGAASGLAVGCTLSAAFPNARGLILVSGALSTLAVILYAFAEWRESRGAAPRPSTTRFRGNDAILTSEEDRVRARLSAWTSRWLTISLVFAGAALADTIGNYFYILLRDGTAVAAFGIPALTATAVVPLLREALKRLPQAWGNLPGSPSFGDFIRRFGRQAALVVGLLLVIALLAFWASVAHLIAWRLAVLGSLDAWGGDPVRAAGALATAATALTILAWLMGISLPFVNLSSFAAFYAGRLRRAYLGASNPARDGTPADQDVEGDDLTLEAYYAPASLAPVHLINITINETTSRGSRIILRDRKGKPLVISPAGYLYAGPATSGEMNGARLWAGEKMPLSSWIGISGAAFSTGVGQNTSLGQSLIAGIANMRLGYWWEAPRPYAGPGLRGYHASLQERGGLAALANLGFKVQAHLLREFRASFQGTDARRWYLSDGGHFENTGVYALLRRRVELILVCDGGADPNYQYDDVANLLRKARIDLGVQIEFLDKDELNGCLGDDTPLRKAFGTLDNLASPERTGLRGPYAALARIVYPATDAGSESGGTLLLLKPRLAGAEARDILRYASLNKAFPQQSTLDQFFDEAQWESYYELGRRMADAIFDPAASSVDGGYWSPASMQPLPSNGSA